MKRNPGNIGKKVIPLNNSSKDQVQRVNVDFGMATLCELDDIARKLNISRQAVIKMFIQRALDQHFLAKKARRESDS